MIYYPEGLDPTGDPRFWGRTDISEKLDVVYFPDLEVWQIEFVGFSHYLDAISIRINWISLLHLISPHAVSGEKSRS